MIRDSGVDAGSRSLESMQALLGLEAEIARQALAIAYNNSYLVASLVLASMIPLILLYRKPKG